MTLIRRKDKICIKRISAIRLIKDVIPSLQRNPEVGAPTVDAPEEVCILGFGCCHQ